MKRNVKNVGLVVMIFVIVAMLLGGCCCCITCPPYPQPQFQPQILAEITYCPVGKPPYNEITKGMINHMRDIAPMAYRWGAKKLWQLTDLDDTQKVIDNINIMSVDIISTFHSQPGCELLPFGYVKYPNGMKTYITAVWDDWNNKVEFYKVTNNGPIKMDPDHSITEIVLY